MASEFQNYVKYGINYKHMRYSNHSVWVHGVSSASGPHSSCGGEQLAGERGVVVIPTVSPVDVRDGKLFSIDSHLVKLVQF